MRCLTGSGTRLQAHRTAVSVATSRDMQDPTNPSSIPAERSHAGAPARAADVPSDQLWRQAIQATRQAATAAAELREALGASRADRAR